MADPLASALERTFVLADSGDYEHWPPIAAQLAKEGYGPKPIARIGRDRAIQRELAARMLEVAKAAEEARRPCGGAKRMSPALRPDAFMARRR